MYEEKELEETGCLPYMEKVKWNKVCPKCNRPDFAFGGGFELHVLHCTGEGKPVWMPIPESEK